jgi:glycosyltransferase involved in cell wall biosynthesis
MARILVFSPYVPHPVRHGGAMRSRVLLDALRADHEVHLAAAVTDSADASAAAELAAAEGIQVHALPAVRAPSPKLVRKLARWALGSSELVVRRWQRSAPSRAAAIADAVRPDLSVVDGSFALPVAVGPRQVLFLHNVEYAMFARDDGRVRSASERLTRHFEARGLRNWERAAIAGAALTVTVSDDDRELARGLCPTARIETVPNSVDLANLPLQPPAAADAAPRLLFVGSLDYPPNLEAVTELVERHLPSLREAFPGLRVRLVGRDPDGLGRKFADVPGVERIGPVDDLVPQYRDVHAVYLPIRSGGGTRIKILEAWALGVPVLSTTVGCEGLPATDGEYLRRFESPTEGIAALRAVLAGQAQRLREQGRALVEMRFSHAAAVARLRALVGDVLQRELSRR